MVANVIREKAGSVFADFWYSNSNSSDVPLSEGSFRIIVRSRACSDVLKVLGEGGQAMPEPQSEPRDRVMTDCHLRIGKHK